MKKVFVAIGLIFVLVVFTSVHTQAQEIYGCVSKRDGKLRIVDDTSNCNLRKENPISWNIEGPQGEQGPPGVCDCPITQEQLDDLIARIEYLELPRFTDMGDGTIRDNRTGLIWLKNASCSDLPYTDSDGRANWENAELAAASLADGTCGLTDGSKAGDWRLPKKEEWELFLSPRVVFEVPALVNTVGNAQWSEGDAFTGVEGQYYWSSNERCNGPVCEHAWFAALANGSVYYDHKDHFNRVWPVRSGN